MPDPNGMEVTTNFTYGNIRSDEESMKEFPHDVPGSITNLRDMEEDEKYFAEMKRLVRESKMRKKKSNAGLVNENQNDLESTLNVNKKSSVKIAVKNTESCPSLFAVSNQHSDPTFHYESETKGEKSPSLHGEENFRRFEETSL